MIVNFKKEYQICTCKKVTLEEIINSIKNQGARTLGRIQELTSAGTECRYCIFQEGDFGKIKKKLYCKDVLNELKVSGELDG